MVFYKYFRPASAKTLAGALLILSLCASPAYSVDTKDSHLFITGFNAYLKKDYQAAIENLSGLLEQYPEASLRDMAILWLSRSYFKAGNQKEAARYVAQFFKEYPDNPLKGTIEDELKELGLRYQREQSPAGQMVAKASEVPAAGIVNASASSSAAPSNPPADETARLAAENTAKEKAEQERIAVAKAETDRQAAQKLTAAKAEADRQAAVKAAKVKPATKRTIAKAAAKQKEADTSQALRDQAIAGFKAVADSYPGTEAAANAINRLKKLGINYPLAAASKTAAAVNTGETTRVLSVEVDRQAVVEFTLAAEQQTVEIGKRFSVPFTVVNRGNSSDTFTLESGLPKEYLTSFTASAAPDKPLAKTPLLAPGEKFSGMLQFEMPTMSLDGERKLFPVKVLSETDGQVSQSRPVRMVAKAPILRAVVKSDLTQVAPGESIPYKLVLLNVGSGAAKDLSLQLTFPPQYEPVDPAGAGFKPAGSNSLVMTGLPLGPGESREIALTMKLKESALAKEELLLHVDMINAALSRADKFVSAAANVKSVSGFTVKAHSDKIIVVPGQTVSVLLSVTNTGNSRDDFVIKPLTVENLTYAYYPDTKRNGIRQPGEQSINHIGPLAPKEVATLILEITSANSVKDGVTVPLDIALDSVNDPYRKAVANVILAYSRPVLNLTVAGKEGKLRPGEVNSFELSCVNVGSSMAKMVDIRSSLPDQLELVASEPVVASRQNGEYTWTFDELGSGEKRKISVSYRIKPGTSVGTSLALKNEIKYLDQVGNSY